MRVPPIHIHCKVATKDDSTIVSLSVSAPNCNSLLETNIVSKINHESNWQNNKVDSPLPCFLYSQLNHIFRSLYTGPFFQKKFHIIHINFCNYNFIIISLNSCFYKLYFKLFISGVFTFTDSHLGEWRQFSLSLARPQSSCSRLQPRLRAAAQRLRR